MATITLTKGKSAIVDDADLPLVSGTKWHAMTNGYTWYAVRKKKIGGKKVPILMHRQILGLTERTQQADHINRDGLDNRRANLRVATQAENNANTPTRSRRGRGIYRHWNKWAATIRVGGKSVYLGLFEEKATAAAAYNVAAIAHFGEFATLNKIPGALYQTAGAVMVSL